MNRQRQRYLHNPRNCIIFAGGKLYSNLADIMEYNHREIEKRWQKRWQEEGVYNVREDINRPKFYVLDMFPYPSGAGLH